MSKLLAILNRIDTAASVLVVAQRVAARIDGCEILVLHPGMAEDPSFMPTEEVMTTERQLAFAASTGRRADALRNQFERWTPSCHELNPPHWLEVIGDIREIVGTEGSLADFIVMGHALADDAADVAAALAAALHESGRPVVMAPLTPPESVGRFPVVAWEASTSMSKILLSARPILARAERIMVLQVLEGQAPAAVGAEELERALGGVGAPLDVRSFDIENRHVGDQLLQRAVEAGADLIVMGAYTHGKLHEWLFAGATRDMLRHAGLPLLMQH